MAIPYLKLTPVKRAGSALARSAHNVGAKLRVSRGALGKASYLSGQKLLSELDGKYVDYRSKTEGVEFSAVVLPDGATMDREALWNAIDNYKVRKDAIAPTVARDMVVATPHELSFEERKAVNLELARQIADRYGVAVDIGMHRHTDRELAAGSDARNFHCHVLISERRVSASGEVGKIQRDFNQMDCTRTDKRERVGRLEPRQTAAAEIRQMWERIANDALERGGHSERIDMRSYKEQGIDKIPGKHRGAAATRELREAGREKMVIVDRSSITAKEAAAELARLERAARERHREASARIEAIQRERRVGVSAHVSDHIGGLDAWTEDAFGQLMRAWRSMDLADAHRRTIREINQRHILRAATKDQDMELRVAGRERHRAQKLLAKVEVAKEAVASLALGEVLAVTARSPAARVKEIERAAKAVGREMEP